MEPEREAMLQALEKIDEGWVSPLSWWEAVVVVEGRLGEGPARVRRLLADADLSLAPVGAAETTLAFEAWRRFGKGRHDARLNLGDCFAYALAKSRDLPLLYK